MCGFCGIVNYDINISGNSQIIRSMFDTLSSRGPDEEGIFLDDCVNLGHKRLIVIDPENGSQPMSFSYQGNKYTIVYNGQIYNTKELKKILIENGFDFDGHSDTEILLKAYVHFGYEVPKYLNGIFSFAIWDNKQKELFIARDPFWNSNHFIITFKNNNFIFGSEIKSILKHPDVSPIIDTLGLCELFGIGPSHTPGLTPFKDIFELKPGYFAVFDRNGLKMEQYFALKTKPHEDNFEETCEKIKFYLDDSIEKQLVSDVPLGMMLSGGLDSSIITAYASKHFSDYKDMFKTFSVDYVDNDINFKKSDFQPNADKEFIQLMIDKYGCNHTNIVLDTPELAKSLEQAMIARDMPGMADVDSSLYLFCKEIKKDVSVVLSGECSDEIFAGYPWFFREDALSSNTFPWSIAIRERQKLLNPAFSNINLKEYIDCRYNQALSEVEFLDSDSMETIEKRKISYLTLNWWMQTLLDRSDRMSMASGLELRVPFCDYRLVQYMWNVPWEMKALNGREKGLLRYVMKDILPKEIVDRKKSPYPKTHNPNYLKAVKNILEDILEKPDAPIKTILNENYIKEILSTDGNAFSRPWFGQLMTGPQLMAYICQVNMWLEKYQPKIEL